MPCSPRKHGQVISNEQLTSLEKGIILNIVDLTKIMQHNKEAPQKC